MPGADLFCEDHLTPVRAGGDTFWFADRLAGTLVCGPPYRSVTIDHLDSAFLLPGDDHIVELSVGERGMVSRWHAFGEHGTALAAQRDYPVGRAARLVPDEVVGGPCGRRYAVLRDPSGPACVLVDLMTGEVRRLPAPRGSGIRAVLSNGAVVDHAAGHALITENGIVRRSGRVVAVNGENYILSHDDRVCRRFTLVTPSGSRALVPPDGWYAHQAVLTSAGPFVTCVHPKHGSAIWDGERLGLHAGSIRLFAVGAPEPLLRVTGLATGSRWVVGFSGTEVQGAEEPRPDILVERHRIDGVPATLFRSRTRDARVLVVSLHGGPDSSERDDLRYGGAYRQLLDRGCDVLAVDYPGSRDSGTRFQQRGWRAWGASAASVVRTVQTVSAERGYARTSVFGVSFGAWLAVPVARGLGADRLVALSPVLALRDHLRAHSAADPEFRRWATRRFGPGFEHAVADNPGPDADTFERIAIVPRDDEVVAPDGTVRAALQAGWEVHIVPGRHYPASAAEADARWPLAVDLLTGTPAAAGVPVSVQPRPVPPA